MPRYTVIRLEDAWSHFTSKSVSTRYLQAYNLRVSWLINRILKPHGGIAFSLNTGEYIALTNTVSRDIHVELQGRLEEEAGVRVRVASVVASNPVVALLSASQYFKKNTFYYEEGGGEAYHIISLLLPFSSGYDAYVAYSTLSCSVLKSIERYGGLVVERAGWALTILLGGGLEEAVSELSRIGFVGAGSSCIGLQAYVNSLKALRRALKKRKPVVVSEAD